MALPDIVERVGGRLRVLMDGGITRGTDMVKALALGADAVLVGRAPLWGVAAAGEAGARRAFQILREEALRALGQCGCVTIKELSNRALLWTEEQGAVPAPLQEGLPAVA